MLDRAEAIGTDLDSNINSEINNTPEPSPVVQAPNPIYSGD